MVERTDAHPAMGSATYCSALSLRQVSRTLVLAQRSYANNATTSSCMRITPTLSGQAYMRQTLIPSQEEGPPFLEVTCQRLGIFRAFVQDARAKLDHPLRQLLGPLH